MGRRQRVQSHCCNTERQYEAAGGQTEFFEVFPEWSYLNTPGMIPEIYLMFWQPLFLVFT